ncbi:antibiotic biosynthesis monooxygenase [Aureicoccus marinus]|jgi:heme-degrading monooxygenase HmoA|uniref:Antibiotic biosynthesis monooxygenase n=2 Tax=Aureicoccus marinus TaxID=754435 RepID=A0A2S7TA37_9FLAO|nr:antibiotic biosynthesis monooxygenase [Aureicoccus marinus]
MPYVSPLFPPPYYAVIFTNEQVEELEGYSKMAEEMERLAAQQKGYLGMDHARSEQGITVSYWKNEEDILAWKAVQEHSLAQQNGKNKWYSRYTVRVCRVEREYSWESNNAIDE